MDRYSEMRAFVAVMEAGGFSAAARRMGQSRSSVNRLVVGLEERLGVQLLHRTTRSVSATSSGRALFPRARQLLEDLDELERALSSARVEPVGRLRVSAPPSFGDLDFSKLIVSFMAENARVEIDLSVEHRFVDPVAEGYDVLIRVGRPDDETTLVDHRVRELRYVLCAAPEYLAARGVPQSVDDLSGHAILYQQTGATAPHWLLRGPDGEASVSFRPVLAANALDTLLSAACGGLGVAALPAYAVRSDLEAGRLQAVLPEHAPPSRMLQVIYPPARHLSAKVRLFVDFVEAWCGEG